MPKRLPYSVSLRKAIKPTRQTGDLCTFWACTNALNIMRALEGSEKLVDPIEVAKWWTKFKGYVEFSKKRSASIPECLETMVNIGYIKKYVKVRKRHFKSYLARAYPIVAMINKPRETHAICLTGYTGETYHAIDSNKRFMDREFENLEDIDTAYILYPNLT